MPKDNPFLRKAQDRFKLCEEAENQLRIECLDDLKFRAGDQWPEKVKADRSRPDQNRPCLTINRIPQFLRQITNDQRQNRPGSQVNPVDDFADPDTAEILQGIIRHIEYDSNADAAYDTAFESAATIGFGYWQIVTEFESPESFDQVIKIKRIRNPFSVYFDPNCQEPDYSDGDFAFKFGWMAKEEYKTAHPKSELAGLEDWQSVGDRAPGWMEGKGKARIAEYYYREDKDDNLLLVQFEGQTKPVLESQFPESMRAKVQVLKERKTKRSVIKWAEINAVEKLKEVELPGSGRWIPIIPVLGDELDIDGKRILEGVIRHAKDPQRMYNYWASAETEAIALAPRAPFIAAAGQIDKYKKIWSQANTRNLAVLPYDPQSAGGHLVPPPQREVAEPAVAAITGARLQSADDLKATTGIYDASLGNRSNEQSGKAITARQQQSQISNFHYIDNLSRAIRHQGRILLDWIPAIYDTPRVMRIIGEDGTQKTVKVNQQFSQGKVEKIYDLTVGRYDVTVSAGPSYQTKRQAAAESMIQMTQAYPQLFDKAGDLIAKNLDWPGAQELSERLKKTLPPELQDEDGEDPEAKAQLLEKQLQMLAQQHELLTKALNESQDALESKQADLQVKHDIAAMQEKTKLAIAQLNAQLEEGRLNTQRQLKELELMHSGAMQQGQQQFQAGMQERQGMMQREGQMADQEQERMMAEQQAMQQQQMMANQPQEGA